MHFVPPEYSVPSITAPFALFAFIFPFVIQHQQLLGTSVSHMGAGWYGSAIRNANYFGVLYEYTIV